MTDVLASTEVPPLDAAEAALWRTWRQERRPEQRSALFFHFSDWIRTLASVNFQRYPHALAEWQDYAQLASLGALSAIDRFDPDVQPSFKAFAEPYIRGTILKGLACFTQDSKRRPDIRVQDVIPERVDEGDLYSFEEIVDVAVGLAFGHFLELGIPDQAPADNDPLSIYEGDRQLGSLRAYVDRLPEREQQVVVAHYFQHLPFTEIATLLGVSKPRVTQLHQKALGRIREWFEADADEVERRL